MTSPASPSVNPAVATMPSAPPSLPEIYERELVPPLFRPWAEVLADRVPLTSGVRVLDVACGTGIVARVVRSRIGERGRIVGVDRSPAMLAVARAIDPSVEWREGDAAELPVADDERFDVVFCHQGLQFFTDRLASARAMRRALAPGGHLSLGVWRSVEENGVFQVLDRVAERFVGPVEDARHAFADADALRRLLEDAGFSEVRVAPVSRETRFEQDPTVLARLNAMAVIGMTSAGRAMSERERAELATEITGASVAEMARYLSGGAITFQTSANVATARA